MTQPEPPSLFARHEEETWRLLREAYPELAGMTEAAPLAALEDLLARGRLDPERVARARAATPLSEEWAGFRILGRLGAGEQARVYLAFDAGWSVPCALKVLPPAAEPRAKARFLREAGLLARLEHPAIARRLRAGEHEGWTYVASEWVPGESLAERVARAGPLGAGEVLQLGATLADALAVAHAQGALHRDLRPANVLLGSRGPCLIDFGLAAAPGSDLTRTGGLIGTLAFAAPEQLRDASRAGPLADVFGLGALLYFARCGQPPRRESLEELVLSGFRAPCAPLPAQRVGAGSPGDAELETFLGAALAVEPTERPADMRACARRLSALAADATPTSPSAAPAEVTPPPLRAARLLGEGQRLGPYRLAARVGQGAHGVVYEAFDEVLQRQVAVKLLRSDDPRAVARLSEEARVLARLRHPHVLALLGAEREPPHLILEWAPGGDLADRLRREGALALAEALPLLTQVADALAHAHAQGVLHRDLKPSNVLFSASGAVKLADFGIARRVERETLTRSGAALGTFAYMAPEQARGEAKAAADVYAFGLLLHEALSGQAPLPLLRFAGEGPGCDPSQLPPPLDQLCARALAEDPRERPGAAECAEVCRRALDRATGSALPPRAWRAALALAFALSGLVGLALWAASAAG